MSSFFRFTNINETSCNSKCNISAFLNRLFLPDLEYIVVWYGRVVKEDSGVKVRVFFVNRRSEFYINVLIPLQLIIQMPIGSVWKNGVCVSKLIAGGLPLVTLRDARQQGSILTNVTYQKLASENYISKLLGEHYNIQKGSLDAKNLGGHTLISISIIHENKDQKLILHPLLFLNAHYGVSSEIPLRLIGDLWSDIFDRWHLGYCNPLNEKAVLLSNSLKVADAVFLHYLKNDKQSLSVVRALNQNIQADLITNQQRSLCLSVC